MLQEFITTNRTELINRCRHTGAKKYESPARVLDAEYGVPLFLDQLVETLRAEAAAADGRDGLAPEQVRLRSEIGRAAALRGSELLYRGYTVDQVVREYGNICQAITELAIEEKASLSNVDFKTLNRCLDDAIADAVSSYVLAGKAMVADQAQDLHARLDHLAEEHRRMVDVATRAFSAIKAGNVGVAGATGSLLAHALSELRNLVDRAVSEMRSAAAATSASARSAQRAGVTG